MNRNCPNYFSLITEKYVEWDNLLILLESIGRWLSCNSWRTRQQRRLASKVKDQYCGGWKAIYKIRFRSHPLITGNQEWRTDLRSRFVEQCVRSRAAETVIVKKRKSEPLYCDISQDQSAICAKHSGELLTKIWQKIMPCTHAQHCLSRSQLRWCLVYCNIHDKKLPQTMQKIFVNLR